MPPTLFTKVARNTLALVHESVQGRVGGLEAEATEELAFACSTVANAYVEFLDQVQRLLRKGVEVRGFLTVLTEAITVADSAVVIAEEVKAVSAHLDVRAIDEAFATIGRVRNELRKLTDWLTSPRSPVDANHLHSPPPEARADYEDLAAVVARLEAGGEL